MTGGKLAHQSGHCAALWANAIEVNTMSKTNEVTAKYSVVLKNWQAKVYGPKPTIELLNTAHALGCRPGKQALAIAMNLRAEGATTAQIVAACAANWGSSGTHNNKRDQLVRDMKVARRVAMPDDAFGHTVYKIALTPKGEGKAKPSKATAKAPVVPATVETPIAPVA